MAPGETILTIKLIFSLPNPRTASQDMRKSNLSLSTEATHHVPLERPATQIVGSRKSVCLQIHHKLEQPIRVVKEQTVPTQIIPDHPIESPRKPGSLHFILMQNHKALFLRFAFQSLNNLRSRIHFAIIAPETKTMPTKLSAAHKAIQ